MSNNLTTGKPLRLITCLWGSVIFGDAIMQIVAAITGVIAGHSLGLDALGGMSVANASVFHGLVLAMLMGLIRGFAVPMSNAFGAGDFARMRRLLWPGLMLSLVGTTVISLASLPFGDWILQLMQTPPENFLHASRYSFAKTLSWMPSILFTEVFYICHAIGDGKLASFGQVIVAALTLLLYAVFLMVCDMGAEGAAYAVLYANLIGGILLLALILRKFPQLKPQKGDFRVRLQELRCLFGNGMSNSIGSVLMAIAVLMLQTAINSMGAVYVNAYAVASRLFALLSFPIADLDMTIHDYLCQNAGAMRWDRIRQGFRSAMLLILGCCGFFLLLGTVFTKELVALLADAPDAELISLVRQYMLIVGIFTLVYGASTVYRHTPAAMGHPGSMALTGGLEGIGRLVACLLVYRFGFIGACLLLPFGWVARVVYDVGASYYYLHKVKKE